MLLTTTNERTGEGTWSQSVVVNTQSRVCVCEYRHAHIHRFKFLPATYLRIVCVLLLLLDVYIFFMTYA